MKSTEEVWENIVAISGAMIWFMAMPIAAPYCDNIPKWLSNLAAWYFVGFTMAAAGWTLRTMLGRHRYQLLARPEESWWIRYGSAFLWLVPVLGAGFMFGMLVLGLIPCPTPGNAIAMFIGSTVGAYGCAPAMNRLMSQRARNA